VKKFIDAVIDTFALALALAAWGIFILALAGMTKDAL
jgi:uncharacterized membrane protein